MPKEGRPPIQRRPSEYDLSKRARKEVLDWKLDFYNDKLQELFNRNYNETFVRYFRVGLTLLIISFLFSTVGSFIYYGEIFRDEFISLFVPVVCWEIIWLSATYFSQKVRDHSVSAALITLYGVTIVYVVIKAIGRKFLDDSDGSALALLLLQIFTTLRLPVKQGFIFALLPVSFHIIFTAYLSPRDKWYFKLAEVQTVISLVAVGIFAGYSLEKRTKLDFVCKYLMEIESEKLEIAMERDVALLHNIFPKKLSDELEQQMGKTAHRRTHHNIRRVRPISSNADAEKVDPFGRNPLVKIISSFTSRNESAGWRALQFANPETAAVDVARESSPRMLSPRTVSPRSPHFQIDIFTPRSASDSASSTPRLDPATSRIDISTPRVETSPRITTPRNMVTPRPGTPPGQASGLITSPSAEVTPRSAALLNNLPPRTARGSNSNRASTDRDYVKPTPRSVIPIYPRSESRWHSTTSLPNYAGTLPPSTSNSSATTATSPYSPPSNFPLPPSTSSSTTSSTPYSPPSNYSFSSPTATSSSSLSPPSCPPTSYPLRTPVPPLRLPSQANYANLLYKTHPNLPPFSPIPPFPSMAPSSRSSTSTARTHTPSSRPRSQSGADTPGTPFTPPTPFSPSHITTPHSHVATPHSFSRNSSYLSASSSYSTVSVPPTPLSTTSSNPYSGVDSVRSEFSTDTAVSYNSSSGSSGGQSSSNSSGSSGSHGSSGINGSKGSNDATESNEANNTNNPPSESSEMPVNYKPKRRLSVVIPMMDTFPGPLSPLSHAEISPSVTPSATCTPPIIVVPPSPATSNAGTPTANMTPRAAITPRVVATAATSSLAPNELVPPSGMPPKALTASGRPQSAGPELYTFFNGAQHADGTLIALSHAYPEVTVVIADIVGFTALSSTVAPQELVDILNTIFSLFDDIMEDFQLEKIRTIGDAYLCVANMSIPLDDHENRALEAAYCMLDVVQRVEKKGLNLRVGIGSGPLIAGVTGTMKWNYDIFGNALVEATLMETSSLPGFISVTRDVFEACQDNPNFTFEKCENVDTRLERYQVTPTNALERSESEIKIDFFSNFNETIQGSDEDIGALAIWSSLFVLEGLQTIDSDWWREEVPMADISYFHDQNTYNHATLELNYELDRMNWRTVWTPMLTGDLDREYNASRRRKTHPFMLNYVTLLFITINLYSVLDIFIIDTHSKAVRATIQVVQFALLCFYAWFIRRRDNRKYAEWMHVGIIWFIGFAALVNTAYDSNVYRVHRMAVIMAALSICYRIQPKKIMVILITLIIPATIVVVAHRVRAINLTIAISNYYIVLFVAAVTQIFMEMSLRTEFIFRKLIDVNVIQYKHTQYRAKLLLQNILPEEIIPRLQRTASKTKSPRGVVDLFDDATIMFVNIVNLEELTSSLDASDTFNFYNEIFTAFDEATRSFGLEKIKTIYSVYMVASGLPRRTTTHAEDAVKLAIELYRIASTFSVPPHRAQIRVGIATGPVVAGIIGKKKYSYDCWSDTTNTASRMESNGFVNCVQVSPATYERLKDTYTFTMRENIYIKGKGHMNTYYFSLGPVAPT